MDQMRRVEPLLVISFPQDLSRQTSSFRQGYKTLDSVSDNGFSVVHCAEGVVDDAIVGVMTVNQTDIPLVPDLVRAADNVVDNVGVAIIKAFHRVSSRPVGGYQVDIVVPFDLQDFALGAVFFLANVAVGVLEDVAVRRG